MLRSAPLFAAWCAADPGSVVPGGGSRLCGAAQGRCTASGTRDRRSHLRMRAIRGNQKGGLEARRLIKPFPIMPGCPGEARLHPGFEGYFLDFFFDFDFFAFFAFFAFLAIVSSQGLMDGNATRGMLGGGPASQHPRIRSQQIRGALPRTVTPVSSRYPQLLCVLTPFLPRDALSIAKNRAPRTIASPPRLGRVNDAPTCRCILDRSGTAAGGHVLADHAVFIISTPRRGLLRRGETPLSGAAAL